MPTKIKDAEGKEHDVYSPQEIEDMVKAKTVDKDQALEKLNKELEELKKDDKNKDWSKTRELIATLEGKIDTLTKERDTDRTKFSEDLQGVRTSLFKDSVDAMVKGLAAGDAELEKKIKFHYDRLGKDVKTEKEASDELQNAYLLATGKQSPNPLAVARGAGGGQPPIPKEQASQQVAELGRKFGLSDEDITKFGNKAKEKKPGNLNL